MPNNDHSKPTIGSLFAGIGGFDLGLERAGFKTAWQVEIDAQKRKHLAHRFPWAQQFSDIKTAKNLSRVDIITAGFPCQDFSNAGRCRIGGQKGLGGERSGLFFETLRIIDECRPRFIILENVAMVFSKKFSADFATIIQALAERNYLGQGRVLDGQYFGVPQRRRRIYLVAGLGSMPKIDFMDDTGSMDAIPSTFAEIEIARSENEFASFTLAADKAASKIGIGCEVLVAESGCWHQMVERQRISRLHGLPIGLDKFNCFQKHGAGNAIIPKIAEWIGKKLINQFSSP